MSTAEGACHELSGWEKHAAAKKWFCCLMKPDLLALSFAASFKLMYLCRVRIRHARSIGRKSCGHLPLHYSRKMGGRSYTYVHKQHKPPANGTVEIRWTFDTLGDCPPPGCWLSSADILYYVYMAIPPCFRGPGCPLGRNDEKGVRRFQD